ncbi:hypothetical protein PPERSA_08008 [Pseudocohnilembus persalinus]|uniref:GrpB family protein n=1 Tax=Pseudocohnilembus persalinus TaxID=266149 RepID=A0A0V0R2F5_PSEPJ|nr:hypothetical protein PPERSA_08008 [Pseudocohnilembus persalinus]|eukprot:KRX08697.1 hypothetical protein PPERSA_08008 [Pseudocohnilembus persalinus]
MQQKSEEQLNQEKKIRQQKPIQLYEYNPIWPKLAEQSAKELKEIMMPDLDNDPKIKGFQHIGSTSIKGMAGTRFIDLAVMVKDVPLSNEVSQNLKKNGYLDLGMDHMDGGQWFQKRNEDQDFDKVGEAVVIHAFAGEKGLQSFKQFIAFRDYLNHDEKAKNQYLFVKKSLEKENQPFIGYKKKKSEFVKQISEESVKWADKNNLWEKYK